MKNYTCVLRKELHTCLIAMILLQQRVCNNYLTNSTPITIHCMRYLGANHIEPILNAAEETIILITFFI